MKDIRFLLMIRIFAKYALRFKFESVGYNFIVNFTKSFSFWDSTLLQHIKIIATPLIIVNDSERNKKNIRTSTHVIFFEISYCYNIMATSK
jgi:hypothetical protein